MNVAIGMMIFIFLVANIGGLYFLLRDHNYEINTEQK